MADDCRRRRQYRRPGRSDPCDSRDNRPLDILRRAGFDFCYRHRNNRWRTLFPRSGRAAQDILTEARPLRRCRPGYADGSRNGTAGTYETYVGFLGNPSAPTQVLSPEAYNNTATRRIELTPSNNPDDKQVAVHGDGLLANDDLDLDIQPPIAVVINPPDFVLNEPKRLSVSEPTKGYKKPFNNASTPPNAYEPAYDAPFDRDPAVTTNGTTPRYRLIYLQRLANPLREYNADTNPYRTIDKAQIDLTAFNGLGPETGTFNVTNGTYAFFSRERGEDEETQAGQASQPNNIWAVEIPPNATDQPAAVAANEKSLVQSHYFGYQPAVPFAHTLGYLNEGFGAPQLVSSNTAYNGSPPHPFPWLTWLNRPFLSEMEMMLVPKERSSQLLNKDTATPPVDKFFYPTTAKPAGDSYKDSSQPYGHVINFFFDNDTTFP